jgi:uncharacterized protein
MKNIVVLTLLVLLIAAPAAAQNNLDARAITEELLVLNNVESNVQRMLTQIKDLQMNQLETLGLTAGKTKEAKVLQERLFAILEAELSWESMKEEYIDVYTDVFTREELHALLDFSRSEMGRNINAKMPLLMEKSMQIGHLRAQKAMPKMQEILEEFFAH